MDNRGSNVLFLAGGITGCPDWQAEIVDRLSDIEDLTILNPRRADFPIDDPSAAEAQITWEFRHLRQATLILFWFPKESICPIALYELGAWTVKPGFRQLLVGVDPEYSRRQDVVIQTRLVHPDLRIDSSVSGLVDSVRTLFDGECLNG
jgi:hypothetical protein